MATLTAGRSLVYGESLVSPNLAFYFTLLENGNLQVTDDISHVHWLSNTPNKGIKPYKLTLEEDRNLMVFDSSGVPVWSSNTWSPTPDPSAELTILNNRDVVLTGTVEGETQVLWSTNTAMPVKSTLYMDENIYPGKVLLSPNMKYCLRMQKDGNVVLYDEKSTPYWASNTSVKPFGFYNLVLQGDMNFIAYSFGGPIWASNTCSTERPSGLKVVLQNDKNLVMYLNNNRIWSVL